MADAFVGEIRVVGFNFAPTGWAVCDGRLLPISQNTALFSLLGTTYGGDGKSTFALPNFTGRVGVGQGQGFGLSNYDLGELDGEESVTLLTSELPPHHHLVGATGAIGTTSDPKSGVYAAPNTNPRFSKIYGTSKNDTAAPPVIGPSGGNQPHENRAPGLAMTVIIALEGIFPSRP